MVVCGVFPNRQAVTLRLSKPGEFTPADGKLMDQVAASVSVEGAAPPGPAERGSVTLSNGVRVAVPAGLLLVPEPDPDRTERQLVLAPQQGDWTRVELVPYLALPGEQPETIKSVLAARSHRPTAVDEEWGWLRAKATAPAPGQWRFDPVKPDAPADASGDEAADARPDAARACRAYAVTGAGGAGVLVVMTSRAISSAPDFDEAWAGLSEGISPSDAGDPSPELAAGGKFVSALRDSGWARAAASAPAQYWTWADDKLLGYTRLSSGAAADGSVFLKVTGHVTNWDQTQSNPQAVSTLLPGLKTGSLVFNRQDVAGDGSLTLVTDVLTLSGDSYALKLRQGRGPWSKAEGDVPAQFVPSGLLCAALSKAPPGRMILRTERFPACDAACPVEPLALLVDAAAASVDGKDDRRCVVVQVNGSGRLSRWYFNPDGTLDSAEFAGGVGLRASERGPDVSEVGKEPRTHTDSHQ